MNIGIYANIDYGKWGGVQQYIEKLVNALLEETKENVCIFTNEEFYNNYFKRFNNYPRFIYYFCTNDEIDFKNLVRDVQIDILHFPIQSFPYYYWNIPTVITLHDMQHEYFKEFFTEDELEYRKTHYAKSVYMADQIIVSFQHVKTDILKFYDIPEDKVTVATPAMQFGQKQRFNTIDLKEAFQIDYEYLLYPAQTWEHKNHIRLLKALKILKEKYHKSYKLICTGAKNRHYSEIENFIVENNLQENVVFLGFVPDEALMTLYKNTQLVVIPTLYEAGSFPLMEAMAYHVPVICSNVTSLPDTIGDERFIFNPYDECEIADKIYQMLYDEDLRKDNIENSKKKVQLSSWKNQIGSFITAYHKAIDHYNWYKQYKKHFHYKMLYEETHKEELSRIKAILDNIPNDKTIVIYAAGVHTKHLLNAFDFTHKNLIGIVDKNNYGQKLLGYEIKSLNYIHEVNPDIIIVSSCNAQNEIEDYLIHDMGYKGNIIKLYDNQHRYPFYQ